MGDSRLLCNTAWQERVKQLKQERKKERNPLIYVHLHCSLWGKDFHINTVAREGAALATVQWKWNACATYLAPPQYSREVITTVQGCVEIAQMDWISYF